MSDLLFSVSNYTSCVNTRSGMHTEITQASKEDLGNDWGPQ